MWDVYCMRLSELKPFVLISGIFKKILAQIRAYL